MPTIEPDWVSPAAVWPLDPLGQAEVGDQRDPALRRLARPRGQQDVRRLEVAVEDAPLMGIMDRAGDGRHQGRGGARVRGVSPDVRRQAPAVDELHAEVMVPFVLADLVDGHDVRVIEVRRGLRLQAEPLQVVGGREPAGPDHLQRQHAVQADLPRLEDDPHAALGDHLDQLVVAEVADPAVDRGRRAAAPG